jgi:hypothetical protein
LSSLVGFAMSTVSHRPKPIATPVSSDGVTRHFENEEGMIDLGWPETRHRRPSGTVCCLKKQVRFQRIASRVPPRKESILNFGEFHGC